jgi:quinoprotein glucose dehydrogenase
MMSTNVAPRVVGFITALYGIPLLLGGITLISLGGSIYFVMAGSSALISGVLLFARKSEGLWLYAIFLAGTLVWSLSEVGLSAWELMPRMLIPLLLGVCIFMPWVRRSLTPLIFKKSSRKSR